MTTKRKALPELYGRNDFCLSVDEEGRSCVREYGTPFLYTPGDPWGHQWDEERHQRILAPRYVCDALVKEHAMRAWVEDAREACAHFGIAENC